MREYISKWKFVGGCVGSQFSMKNKKQADKPKPEFMYRSTKNYILGE